MIFLCQKVKSWVHSLIWILQWETNLAKSKQRHSGSNLEKSLQEEQSADFLSEKGQQLCDPSLGFFFALYLNQETGGSCFSCKTVWSGVFPFCKDCRAMTSSYCKSPLSSSAAMPGDTFDSSVRKEFRKSVSTVYSDWKKVWQKPAPSN